MKDASFYILTEFYRLLNGVISVPVYQSEQPIASGVSRYVRLLTVTSLSDNLNKDRFGQTYTVMVDATDKVPDVSYSELAVTNVVNEVLGAIYPNVDGSALNDSTDFAVLWTRHISTRSIPVLTTGTEKIIRKIIEFEVTINQK